MIRSFVFKDGRLVGQDITLDTIRLFLYDDDVQMWVDAEGAADDQTRMLLETIFSFHPLAVEDCLAASERPKVDQYENYIFLTIHAVDFSSHEFQTTELNMFIGKNFLVTYHESPLMSITATIDRVLKNPTAVARAPDRLSYTILDFLLDNYEPALADLSTDIADLETSVLTDPARSVMANVLKLKKEVQRLNQIIYPQREVIARIARGEFKIVRAHMLPYYRDLLDRLLRISSLAETYRDSLTGVLQVHLNLQQSQANQVTKVLTVLATLTAPMLLITSFYGMNVRHFPNDRYPVWFDYLWIFGLTALVTGLVYLTLKRRKWM